MMDITIILPDIVIKFLEALASFVALIWTMIQHFQHKKINTTTAYIAKHTLNQEFPVVIKLAKEEASKKGK
jgi:hypothetical protein